MVLPEADPAVTPPPPPSTPDKVFDAAPVRLEVEHITSANDFKNLIAKLKESIDFVSRERKDFENASAALQKKFEEDRPYTIGDVLDIEYALGRIRSDIAGQLEATAASQEKLAKWTEEGETTAEKAVGTIEIYFAADCLNHSIKKHVEVILKVLRKLSHKATREETAAKEKAQRAEELVEVEKAANDSAAQAKTSKLRKTAQANADKETKARQRSTWWANVGKRCLGAGVGAAIGAGVGAAAGSLFGGPAGAGAGAGIGAIIGGFLGALAAWCRWCDDLPAPTEPQFVPAVVPQPVDQALQDALDQSERAYSAVTAYRADIMGKVNSAEAADKCIDALINSIAHLHCDCRMALRNLSESGARSNIARMLSVAASELRAIASHVRRATVSVPACG